MNAKLISIFTAAGVVAAGSTAFAINSHTLKTPSQHSVGTAPQDPAGPVEGKSQSQFDPATDEVSLQSNESIDTSVNAGTPATDEAQAISDSGQTRQSQKNQNTNRNPGAISVPSTPDPTPSLPSVPPNFNPGQDGGDDDEYDDDSGNGEHDDSEYEDDWEHEDD